MPNHNESQFRKKHATKEDRDLRDKRFVTMVSDGVSVVDAAIALGYSEESAEVQGYKLKRRLSEQIIERQMAKLSGKANRAINEIYKLAMTATRESIRLNACKDILDRAGFKATERVVQHTTVSNSDEVTMTPTEDLEAELADILKGTQLDGNGLDNVTVMPGVSADEALDDWTPPEGFDEDDDDETK